MATQTISVKKKSGDTGKEVIFQKIIIRPVVRTVQSIDRWRNNLKSAEAIVPIRVPIYDSYADILLDATLNNLVEKRILGVTKAYLTFTDKNGDEIPEMIDLVNTAQFRHLRREIMLQKIWGISVIELTADNGKLNVFSIPRKHIRPDLGKIIYEQYGTDGIDYTIPPYSNYIVQIGDQHDLGLLLKAAPYVIYKRGGFGDWSKFAELFGMPFREARYDGFNDEVRKQLEMAMEQAGSAPYAILPKDADFKLWDVRNPQSSGELYNQLRKACNEELCILMLGQTETTTSSTTSGYAQSITHAAVEDAMNENDRQDEISILNEQILPILERLGFPVKDGHFEHVPAEDQISMTDKATVLVQLKNGLGLPIDDDYLYEEFGIPKPENYDELKSKSSSDSVVQTDGSPSPNNNKKSSSAGAGGNPPPLEEPEEAEPKLSLSSWNRLRTKLADFFDPAPVR